MSQATVAGFHLCEGALRQATLCRRNRSIEIVLTEMAVSQQAAPPSAGVSPAGDALRIACLPAHAVISRCWSMPKADPHTLRRMVANRLEADLPLPIDALTWGCRRAPHASQDGTISILVQASRSEQVGRCIDAFATMGQPLHILTTEAEAFQALHRYGLNRPATAASEVLVLVTAQGWLVAFFADGMIQSLRRLPMQTGRMDLAVRECRQLIESQCDGRTLDRVWWLASGEQDAARACLVEQLRVPVELAEPAANLLVTDAPINRRQLAEYAQPIGLALAGLHEVEQVIRLAGQEQASTSPRRARLDEVLSQPKRWAVAAAALMLLAIMLHVGAIRSEIARMRTLLAEADKASVSAKDVQPKLQAMQRLQTYRIDAEKIMADLSQAVPDTIVVSSIQLSRGRWMVIKGTAKDPKGIFTLADTLRKSSRFRDVKPERAEPAQGGAFTISMDLVGMNPLNPVGPRGGK